MIIDVKPYSSTILFNIEGVDIVGNYRNGSMIGLTEEGSCIIKRILKNESLNSEELSEENIELLKALLEYDIMHDGLTEVVDKPEITSAYLHITNRCNLNCIGCYSLDDCRNKSEDISLDEIKEIIKQLKKYSLKRMVISGGEPFLRDDLDEIIRYSKEEMMLERVFLVTNGTVIKKEVLLKIKPYIDNIAVSIDGFSEEHPTYLRDDGIFHKIKQSIEVIKSYGIPVSILPTLHKKNIFHVDEYVKLAEDLEVNLSFSILTCSSKEFKDFIPEENELVYLGKKMAKADKPISIIDTPLENFGMEVKRTCEAGNKILSIAANGDVYPCHMMHSEKLRFGNILDNPLEELLNSSVAERFRNLSVDTFEKCNDCQYRYLCGGGCRARSLYSSDDIVLCDSYCSMFTEYYKKISAMFKELKQSK